MRYTLAVLFALAGVARAEEVCAPRPAAVLTANVDVGDLLVLPAQIDGRSARVLLDTGSDWNLMKARVARELGLRFKRLARPYRDVSGGRIHQYVTARRFVIGGLQFGADFVALPNAGQSDNGDYDASVGAAALSNVDVEIDGPRKVVTLHHAQQRCSGRLVHWANEWAEIPFGFGEQVPEFDATIDGRRIRAVFDTGASRTLMDLSLARRLFGIAPNSPGVVSLGEQVLPSGKRLPFYTFRFKRLVMGGLAFDDVEVVLGEFDAVPFTLGMSEIKQLHLYVAFRRTVIYATQPAAR